MSHVEVPTDLIPVSLMGVDGRSDAPPVAAPDFVSAMRRLAGAVTIVTTSDNGVWSGLTATAFCSLSAEPPRVLACLNQKGNSFQAVRTARNVCVNVLSEDDADLAKRFAGMDGSAAEARFEMGDWAPSRSGAPVLQTALIAFDCTVADIVDCASHGIVIGDVVDVRVTDDRPPLLWFDGGFAGLAAEKA